MTQPLEKICIDLRAFQVQVNYLKNNDPESYDKNLKIPAWKENHRVEDYSNELLCNVAKFIAHVDMLMNINSYVNDVDANKNILNTISERIIGQVKTFLNHKEYTQDSKLGEELVSALGNLGKILNDFSRPNDPNPPRNRV